MEVNKVLSVLAIAVGFIVVVTVIHFASGTSKAPPKCALDDKVPWDVAQTKVSNSPDYTALVSIKGYLAVYRENTNQTKRDYMPIELRSITDQKFNEEQVLMLRSDCMKLSIHLKDKSYGPKYADSIDIELDTGRGLKEFCTIKKCSSDMVFAADEYYRCKRQKYYECLSKRQVDGGALGYLMLLDFEFELDGNPGKIKDNQFSKDPRDCY